MERVPPPVVLPIGVAVASGLARVDRLPSRLRRSIGGALLVAGAGLAGWAALTMEASGTSPDPRKPPEALVSSGPYRFTRNPIYLGMLSAQAGAAFITARPSLVFGALVAGVFLDQFVIAREERELAERFGDAYAEVVARTPRWLVRR
ncbi:isoprenylcysteine carboxyl methyltransferase [Acidimicrobium ferrooxidans DSM 10331]|uniref:Isoprenylcysteine carboxyl methyltransferase n=1 Tax=Acidimicrobium ferrooxidans (strain DSM 10331 / JCM 15462 / NBRC 103882 / ICP) TaxID=525909 RepID=C7LY29_ACIFD|nr:isoprenylcysteine carboxylmethyltransferase family protein [Acidimicrobium ferrooxidans]ACU53637.1 isoprenylcysteine carboxyl methyltransferase [Acidimicrobium ferrooxidans DSM 10331]